MKAISLREDFQVAREFFKYLVVGGIAFVADFSTLWLGTEVAKIHYLVSAAAGFSLGVVVNYLLSVHWVFNYRRMKDQKMVEFATFAWIGILGLGWNEVLMYFFTWLFNGKYLWAKIPTTALVFCWNFGVRKYFLFRRES